MTSNNFKQAELALAAYSDLSKDMLLGQYIDALQDSGEGLSESQAKEFASTYRVADRYFDGTGLSATVFANDATGETFLAIRGTEASDPKDLLTDLIHIAWLGNTALQPQFISLKLKAAEWLENGVLPQNFTVTGHSLGGFLATGLVADPVFASHISHAYLFNAPGVGGHSGPFAMAYAIMDFLGLAPAYDQSKISNIIAATGISPIAGLGFDAAPRVDILIEDQMSSDISDPPGSRNHSQQVLTDALAVYSIYSQLAPDLPLAELTKLLDAFGSIKDIAGASNSKTLETALDALRIILQNPAEGKITLEESQKTEAGNRGEFYTNLYELQNSTGFKESTGKVQLTLLSDLSPGDLITRIENNDQQGLAARFALVALNPFILEGENLDYSIFNGNNALE